MSTVAAATTMTGKHFIGGQWGRQQRATLESHNPAHWDEIIGVFPAGGAEEANQAVVAARAAFPGWRRTSRIHRADLFDNLAQLVKRDVDKLAELMARECGKVLHEGHLGSWSAARYLAVSGSMRDELARPATAPALGTLPPRLY